MLGRRSDVSVGLHAAAESRPEGSRVAAPGPGKPGRPLPRGRTATATPCTPVRATSVTVARPMPPMAMTGSGLSWTSLPEPLEPEHRRRNLLGRGWRRPAPARRSSPPPPPPRGRPRGAADRHPHQPVRSEQPARLGRRKVLVAHVDPVRPGEERPVHPVVHQGRPPPRPGAPGPRRAPPPSPRAPPSACTAPAPPGPPPAASCRACSGSGSSGTGAVVHHRVQSSGQGHAGQLSSSRRETVVDDRRGARQIRPPWPSRSTRRTSTSAPLPGTSPREKSTRRPGSATSSPSRMSRRRPPRWRPMMADTDDFLDDDIDEE